MARQPRYTLPGQPQHVIQRGNNRTPIFDSAVDYLFFRECLRSAAKRFDCAIHAYVFMTNHIHLLVSPRNAPGISKVMQSVGRRYVRYFNDRHQRTGTLWEGRYRATIIDCDNYLFTCYRYIEENPLRANIVSDPSHYPWSSYRSNALGIRDELVTPHPLYLALGELASTRQRSYRAIFHPPSDLIAFSLIRSATNTSWALGDDAFRRTISRLGRPAAPTRCLPGSGRRRKASGA